MHIVVYVGNRLKALRTEQALTQEELAKKAGVSPTTVVNVERNQQEPHFRTIRKRAEVLEVDPTTLLGE